MSWLCVEEGGRVEKVSRIIWMAPKVIDRFMVSKEKPSFGVCNYTL